MNEFELEIFEQTSDYAEVRLRGGVGVKTRGLHRAAIEKAPIPRPVSCATSSPTSCAPSSDR